MRAEAWVRFAATHVRVVKHHADGTLDVEPLQILELAGRDEARLLAGGLLDAEDLYDVSRRLFPMFAGEGLFSLLCVVNHACEPSVVTRYRSWKGATMMRVEALRDIEAGEELTVSYVDETEPLAARRAALASYRFECRCAKCERESREEAMDRARGVADDVD